MVDGSVEIEIKEIRITRQRIYWITSDHQSMMELLLVMVQFCFLISKRLNIELPNTDQHDRPEYYQEIVSYSYQTSNHR